MNAKVLGHVGAKLTGFRPTDRGTPVDLFVVRANPARTGDGVFVGVEIAGLGLVEGRLETVRDENGVGHVEFVDIETNRIIIYAASVP